MYEPAVSDTRVVERFVLVSVDSRKPALAGLPLPTIAPRVGSVNVNSRTDGHPTIGTEGCTQLLPQYARLTGHRYAES